MRHGGSWRTMETVPITVLVVDDHDHFRVVARLMLEAGGYQVIGEAASGSEALRQAAAVAPDAVLLDVQLPDMDGFAVSRELCRMMPRVAVVLCSVRETTDYQHSVEGCGARGFLAKAALSEHTFTQVLRRER